MAKDVEEHLVAQVIAIKSGRKFKVQVRGLEKYIRDTISRPNVCKVVSHIIFFAGKYTTADFTFELEGEVLEPSFLKVMASQGEIAVGYLWEKTVIFHEEIGKTLASLIQSVILQVGYSSHRKTWNEVSVVMEENLYGLLS